MHPITFASEGSSHSPRNLFFGNSIRKPRARLSASESENAAPRNTPAWVYRALGTLAGSSRVKRSDCCPRSMSVAISADIFLVEQRSVILPGIFVIACDGGEFLLVHRQPLELGLVIGCRSQHPFALGVARVDFLVGERELSLECRKPLALPAQFQRELRVDGGSGSLNFYRRGASSRLAAPRPSSRGGAPFRATPEGA